MVFEALSIVHLWMKQRPRMHTHSDVQFGAGCAAQRYGQGRMLKLTQPRSVAVLPTGIFLAKTERSESMLE